MLTDRDLSELIDRFCVQLGFCTAPSRASLPDSIGPSEVEALVDAVFEAEGMALPGDRDLRRQVERETQAAIARAACRPENMDFFVLDTLANDIEGLSDILRLINHSDIGWTAYLGRGFEVNEVVPALLRLIRHGDVEACAFDERERALVGTGEGVVPAVPMEDLWYRMTERGRVRHGTWGS